MFRKEALELPYTSFMSHLKRTIPHDQFKQITDDMINTLNDEKEGFCQANYYTLQDAKRKLYSLLTKIVGDESGYIIHDAINRTKRRLSELEEKEDQIISYKRIAVTRKASKDRLIKEMEVAKKALTDSLKEELANLAEQVKDEATDKVIRDTIRRLISFLQETELPTPKDGDWKDQDEPNIYTKKLRTLSKQAQ